MSTVIGVQPRVTSLRHVASAGACAALGLTFLLGPGTPVASGSPMEPVSDCWSLDNGSPLVTKVTVPAGVVDVTRRAKVVRIRVAARDTGGPGAASGIKTGQVVLEGDEEMRMGRRLIEVTPGHWAATFRLPRDTNLGRGLNTLLIAGMYLVDRAGNETFLTSSRLSSLGYPSSFMVRARPRWLPTRVTHLGFPSGPIVTRKAARSIRVDATIRGSTPVSGVWVLAKEFGEPHRAETRLHRVPGTYHRFRGRLVIPRWQSNGLWRIYSVTSQVVWGYEFTAYTRDLRRAGLKTTFRVRSQPADIVKPRVTAFARTPDVVDVGSGLGTLSSELDLADDYTGVARATVEYRFASLSTTTTMHRASGTARAGSWTGVATIDPCHSQPGSWRATVTVWDAAGNRKRYTPANLAGQGWPSSVEVQAEDHLPPQVVSFTRESDGSARVTFDEPVNGITTSSAIIHVGGGQFGDPFDIDYPGPAVAGTWACLTATLDPTDCVSGQVTVAQFDPSGNDEWDEVELNPDHQLEATDLAGNPFDRTTRRLS